MDLSQQGRCRYLCGGWRDLATSDLGLGRPLVVQSHTAQSWPARPLLSSPVPHRPILGDSVPGSEDDLIPARDWASALALGLPAAGWNRFI